MDRSDFQRWLKKPVKRSATPRRVPEPLVGANGKLTDRTCARVHAAMDARKIKLGIVMEEMGYKRLNPALGNAMSNARRTMPNPDLLERLTAWLTKAEKAAAGR